jgi:hypothetical protein
VVQEQDRAVEMVGQERHRLLRVRLLPEAAAEVVLPLLEGQPVLVGLAVVEQVLLVLTQEPEEP